MPRISDPENPCIILENNDEIIETHFDIRTYYYKKKM